MPNILVIDDRHDILRALEAMLRASGFDAQTADGGRKGLALLSKAQFDAVIVDIFMPDLDGLATIRAIRASHPNLRIIAISGHPVTEPGVGKPNFLELAVKLGAAAALRKPFLPSQLLVTLERALDGVLIGGPTRPAAASNGSLALADVNCA
ncbi:response regulator [Mangrovibrevibacter kandeliae]|uniref:response regulator n=1 Tax=Mangrovibrevibacter kandeliae TaxID=2968473 RepID=UPI002119A50A|nr:response regulator [Aurantimonas sp. CSK15Z-1]MCQ8782963.1 response regulator [Aurantimonas sp. CSK15Z-1]